MDEIEQRLTDVESAEGMGLQRYARKWDTLTKRVGDAKPGSPMTGTINTVDSVINLAR
jgi:hypothetical protein